MLFYTPRMVYGGYKRRELSGKQIRGNLLIKPIWREDNGASLLRFCSSRIRPQMPSNPAAAADLPLPPSPAVHSGDPDLQSEPQGGLPTSRPTRDVPDYPAHPHRVSPVVITQPYRRFDAHAQQLVNK